MLTIAQCVHAASLPQPAARAFAQEAAMTLVEREKRAYIEGRTVEAELLSMAVDADDTEELCGRVEDAEKERDSANERADKLEDELEVEAGRVEALQRERDDLQACVTELEAIVDLV